MKAEYNEEEMPLYPTFARVLEKWRMQCPASEGEMGLTESQHLGGVWH